MPPHHLNYDLLRYLETAWIFAALDHLDFYPYRLGLSWNP